MIYAALLRGINVGGHVVKMDHLRAVITALGFTNVRTYIQSGNVFVETEQTDREASTRTLEEALRTDLGYDVPVFLRTIPEMEQIVASTAFEHLKVTDAMRLCVVFTAEPIPQGLSLPLRSPKNDMEIVQTTDYEAFVVWYLRDGRPPAAYNFGVLGNRTTSRFFPTLAKLLQAAKSG
jgi:uncharacterized protein (DUF1697 family)